MCQVSGIECSVHGQRRAGGTDFCERDLHSSLLSVVVMKYSGQKQPGKERVFLTYTARP